VRFTYFWTNLYTCWIQQTQSFIIFLRKKKRRIFCQYIPLVIMMCHSRFRSALFHPSCVFQVNFSCEKETAVTIWRLQRVDRHLIGYMTLSSSSTFVVVGPIDRHVCRTYDSSSVFSPLCSISVELTISPIPAYHKQKWPHRGPDPDRHISPIFQRYMPTYTTILAFTVSP